MRFHLVQAMTIVLVAVWAGSMTETAQDPVPCPTESSQEIFTGFLNAWSSSEHQFPPEFTMKPCETALAEMSGSFLIKPLVGCTTGSPAHVSMTLKFKNSSGQQLAIKNFVCAGGSCSETLPEPNTYPGHPLPGTRGAGGLADRVEVSAQTFNWCASQPVNYQVTVTKQPRPGYNVGGDTSANAPVVDPAQTYRGSIHPYETGGQYYKLTLQPGETFYATGSALGHTSYGGLMGIELYDPSLVKVATLLNKAIYGFNTYKTYSFTNPNPTATTYTVRMFAKFYPIHDFSIDFWLGTDAPVLKAFLNVNDPSDPDDFDPLSPEDESPLFVPGSRVDGSSETLPAPDGVIQDYLQVIVAYVAPNGGRVVAPPPGADVSLALSDTSGFQGTAMNYGSSLQPDFMLPNAGPMPFGPAPYIVYILHALDYGGFTTITATRGSETATLKLPQDAHGNWIADVGWHAGQAVIPDPGLAKELDIDDAPAASGPITTGLEGDGLTTFEEYRGFVVRGEHRRTNPFQKDLFISSNLATGITFAFPNLPTGTHRVRGIDETGVPDYRAADRVMNWNTLNGGPQGPIPGHYDQKALRVKSATSHPGGAFGQVFNVVSSPNEVDYIEIYLAPHQALTMTHGFTATQIDNEIARTTGHEVGHGVHVCHRTSANDPCGDGAAVGLFGTADSVMNSNITGTPATHQSSKYNAFDIVQIRLHIR